MSKIEKTLKAIARCEGISVVALKKEMQAAINEAYMTPSLHAKLIPSKGDIPTVEEFMEYTVQKIKTHAK